MKTNTTTNQRTCGDCTACCVVLPIAELKKHRNVPCSHICGHGCDIYNNGRPKVCRVWRCEWLRGNVQEAYRPDKLGAMFHFTSPHPLYRLPGRVLAATEVVEDAVKDNERRIEAVVRRICQRSFNKGIQIHEVYYVPYGFSGSGPLGVAQGKKRMDRKTWTIERAVSASEKSEIEHLLSLSV